MLQRLTKTAVAGTLHWTRADEVIGFLAASRHVPLVICYHSVVENIASRTGDSIAPNLITCKMLDCHLNWLGRRYRFISLDELGSQLERGRPFEEPAVAITFDDGYADVYHHAFPLLKRKGIPATMFVVTDLIGTARLQIYDTLHLLLAHAFSLWKSAPHELTRVLQNLGLSLPERYRMSAVARDPFTAMRALLTSFPQDTIARLVGTLEAEIEFEECTLPALHPLGWEMVSEMYRAGMTIGSHTRTHALLINEGWQRVVDETAGSRRELEARLGITVTHFAYPDGQFNDTVVDLVAAAGYRFGYTTCRHRNPAYPLLTIPRVVFWENSSLGALGRFSPAILSCQVNGVFDLMIGCRQEHGVAAAFAVSSEKQSKGRQNAFHL